MPYAINIDMNTNRLSMLRLNSIRYPAKNSRHLSLPSRKYIPAPNAHAISIHMKTHLSECFTSLISYLLCLKKTLDICPVKTNVKVPVSLLTASLNKRIKFLFFFFSLVLCYDLFGKLCRNFFISFEMHCEASSRLCH